MKSNPLPQKHLSSPQPIQDDIDQGVEQQPQDSLPELETETARAISDTTAHPSRKKRPMWPFILLGIGILGLGAIAFKQSQPNPEVSQNSITAAPAEPKRLPVRATPVKIYPLQQLVFGNGFVSAVRGKHLTFQTSGTITYLKKVNGRDLREGDFVKKGELLAKLDDRRLRAELAQAQAQTAEAKTQQITAQANLSQAQANVEQAKAQVLSAQAEFEVAKNDYDLAISEFKRRLELFDAGVISESDVDVYKNRAEDGQSQVRAAQAQVNAALSNVKAAESQLASAQSQLTATQAQISSAKAGQTRSTISLEDTEIVAPFDGIVAHLNIREGDFWTTQILNSVNTGNYQTVVDSVPIIVNDPSAYEVDVKLPTFYGPLVQPGQSAYVVLDQDMSTASTEGMTQQELFRLAKARGAIFSVSPSVNPGERSVNVTIRLYQGSKNVLDGERVSLWIAVAENPTALSVPLNAIVYRDQKPYVFVVNQQENVVKLRPVTAGIRGISMQEITSGVEVGDLVVTEGLNRLVDGTPVEVIN